MKKIIAFILVLIFILTPIFTTGTSESPATPTDLEPIDPPVEPENPELDPPSEPESDPDPPLVVDYTVSLSTLNKFNVVALNDFHMQGHVRGSVWVGGTMTGGPWMFVDDAAGASSYIYDNQSEVQFKGRTAEQGLDSYSRLSEDAVTNNKNYWWTVFRGLGNNEETCIYVPASEDGVAHITPAYGFPRYVCAGDDTSPGGSPVTYWTDANSVEVQDICGFIIAPGSTINLSGNNRVSVVGSTVNLNGYGEIHINDDPPTTVEPTPTSPPEPTPTPTPLTVTKVLNGEIWSLRCDTMDNTNFTAGGGYWMADINNPTHNTSKEGHRSNHCGNRENWVLFVSEEGKAISLYQLKSGSTGGTLPSIVYRAPADLCSIPEGQFIYDPTNPDDVMTKRLIEEVFIPQNAMPFEEIRLVEGQRLFWISQNGNQVWHHTGVLKKTTPRFAFIINGEPYTLGVGETITLTEVESGLLEIEEIATSNYKMVEITNDEEGHYVVINEIDPPDKPTPTPPPPVVTPTPSPSPSPEVSESPSPSPEVSESPSPSPEVSESPSPSPEVSESPSPSPEVSESPSPSPEVSESPSPSPEVSESPSPSPEVSESPSPSPEVSESPSPSPEVSESPSPSPEVSESPSPSPEVSESPSPSPEVSESPSPSPEVSESPSPSPEVSESPSPSPEVSESPSPSPEISESPSPSPEVSESPSPSPEISESPSPSPEVSESPSPSPEISESPSPSPEVSESPSPSPEVSESPSPSPEISESPSPSPEVSESPSPSPEVSESPSPSPSPEVSESPSPSPEVSESPSPEPEKSCGFMIRKIVINHEYMKEDTIFFFKITSATLEEYIELTVDKDTGIGECYLEGMKHGKFTIEEIDIPQEYTIVSAPSITLYIIGYDMVVEFENKIEEPEPTLPPTTVTPSEVPQETPTPTPSATPSPTVTTSPIPSEVVTESPTPSPTPSESPSVPPTTVTPSEVPSETPTVTPTPSPTPTVTTSPTPTPEPTYTPLPTMTPEPLPSETPTPIPWEEEEEEIETTIIGVRKRWNDDGYQIVRPDHAFVKLFGDGQAIKVVKLTNDNDWFIMLEVPKYNEEGNEIVYEWKEVQVPGYHIESTYEIDVVTTIINRIYESPRIPEGQPQPRMPGRPVAVIYIDEYETALGLQVLINHVGDCFD